MSVIIWLAVSAIMVIFEIISLGLTTIWFAGGALVAALATFLGAHWILQLVIFAAVSLLLLAFTRPIAMKHMAVGKEKTNVESLVGKTANVISRIDNAREEGTVKLGGLEWSARSYSDEVIEADSLVTVKSISGNKLIVESK